MPLKVNDAALTGMKINAIPLLGAKINNVALWPTVLPPLFDRMIALPATRTAAHFKTVPLAQLIKYRAWPGTTFTGELIAEYTANATIANQVPLVRGLDIVNSNHFRFRRYDGDNSSVKGGVEIATGSVNWGTYAGGSIAASQALYMIDVTTRNWIRLRPGVRGGGSAGGSYINFFVSSTAFSSTVTSSFDGEATEALKLAAIQAWIAGMRTNTAREMVIMITRNLTLTPTF